MFENGVRNGEAHHCLAFSSRLRIGVGIGHRLHIHRSIPLIAWARYVH
jgi:hypothetical protein